MKDWEDIHMIMKKGFDLIENVKLSPDSVVVIKPNLCAIKPHETGATTDPRVVEGIIEYLKKEFGISDISIVESNGTQVVADMAFRLLGYEKLSKKLNIKLVNLTKSSFSSKFFPLNTFLTEIRIPHVMENANLFVSVPKIKTHTTCSFTAALKNQYGCNPYPRKTIYHKRLHDAIVDLNAAFRPDLVVVDGIVAMEGRGPVDGLPVRMNTLIFGRDPVAIDHLVARIMGIDPKSVRYLVEAEKRGIGTTHYKTVGRSPKELQRKFYKGIHPKFSNLYGLLAQDSS